MHRHLLIAVALIGLPCQSLAESRPSDETDSYFDELPVVLSASRLMQTVDEAPAAVTVIDRDLIVASGVRDLVDLFRLVPGMVVGQYKGRLPTLGFHGLTDPYFRQLQILIDGFSVYSPVWGGADWSELPISIDDIERIEVVRGPNAATFGANSFLGVVNIITRDPAVERGGKLISNIGENGIRDSIIRYAQGTDDVRYRFTAGQRSDHGLDSWPDSRRSNFFNFRGHYRLSSSDEVKFQTEYLSGSQGTGVARGPEHTDGARKAHIDTGALHLRWTRSINVDEEFWLQFAHSQRSHREKLPYALNLLGSWNYPLDFSYQYQRTDIEFQNTGRWNDELRGVWGAQIRQDGVQAENYFATESWRRNELYRLFGNLEWSVLVDWIVAGGLMLEKNSFTGTSLSPSLAVNYRLAPGQTVRARVASGRRTPTPYEQEFNWRYELPTGLRNLLAGMPLPYSSFVGLPLAVSVKTERKLDDERIRSGELSYLWQPAGKNLGIELHAFEHRLEKMLAQYQYPYTTILGIIDASQPSKYSVALGFDNRYSARIRGGSGLIHWRPWSGGRIYLAGSRTAIKADGPDANAIEASAPKHTVSLVLSQELAYGWRCSTAYYRVGAMRMLSGGDSLPATERIDVVLAKRFKLANSRAMEVLLTVQNANGGIPVFEEDDIDRRTSWLGIRIDY
jgi:iron complex outermembrane receptor protein